METAEAIKKKLGDQVEQIISNGAEKLAKLQEEKPEIRLGEPIVWTRERIELLKKQCCPAEISDDEFSVFLLQCKRTEMDPLAGEADCVPRYSSSKDKNGNWQSIRKLVFQPREIGMEARADRFDDFQGIRYGVVREKDEIEIDTEACTVKHKYKPTADRGNVIGAWAQVSRRGRVCEPAWIPFSERVQTNKSGAITETWQKMPEGQIGKCARMAALRLAYPNTFGGMFIADEIQGEVEATPSVGQTTVESVAASATEKLTSKIVGKAKEEAKVAFGPHKGKLIPGLSAEELAESIALALTKLNAEPDAAWAASVRNGLVYLQAEQLSRFQELKKANQEAAGEPAEPGANG